MSFGENINGIFGPNGSGKTSILESIVFTLFGEKRAALKLIDLIRHGEDKLKTELTFIGIDRKKYTIRRSLKRTKGDKADHKAILYDSDMVEIAGPLHKDVELELEEKLGIKKSVFMQLGPREPYREQHPDIH